MSAEARAQRLMADLTESVARAKEARDRKLAGGAEAAAPLHVDGNHRRWEVSRYTTQADYPVVKVDAYFLDDEASVYQDDYEGDYEGSFDVPVADLPALIEALVKAAVAS